MVAEGLGVYRRLLAAPGTARLAVADVCARLPQGMLSLTVLLAAAQHGSMTAAGLALAGCTVGLAVTAPVRGRLADRHGLAPVAAICCAGFALAVAGLLLAAAARQPTAERVALAIAAGCLMPPLSPGMRSLWSVHVPARLVQTAFALDAAVFDLAYITGPVLASALAVGVAPAAAAAVLLALTGVAIVVIAGSGFRREQAGGAAAGFSLGPLRSAALRELLLVAGLANVALSATEVALTSYVRLHHVLWAAGPLLAELSAGSILGSLLLGARAPAASMRARLPRLLAGYTAGLAVLAAAGLYAPAAGPGHAPGRAVPGTDPGHAVHGSGGSVPARQQHRGAGLDQLGHERRRRGRGGHRRAGCQPARSRPRPGGERGRRGGRAGRLAVPLTRSRALAAGRSRAATRPAAPLPRPVPVSSVSIPGRRLTDDQSWRSSTVLAAARRG